MKQNWQLPLRKKKHILLRLTLLRLGIFQLIVLHYPCYILPMHHRILPTIGNLSLVINCFARELKYYFVHPFHKLWLTCKKDCVSMTEEALFLHFINAFNTL